MARSSLLRKPGRRDRRQRMPARRRPSLRCGVAKNHRRGWLMDTVRASITGACFALTGASCGATDDTGDSMSTVGAGTSAPSTTGSTGIEGGAQPTNGTMTPQPSADPDTSPTGAGATGSGSPLPVPTDAASPGSGVPTDGRPPEEPGMSEGPGATGP